jgi:glycosyltransferase involved in cell wall biosynthesis
MRIVHMIQSAAQIYGAERCLLVETAALRERGHEVHALLCHEARLGEAEDRLERELHGRGIPTERVVATGQVSLQLLGGFVRALRRLRPDVVHSHSMKTDVLFGPLTRLLRVPLVIEVHGYLRPEDDRRVRLYERLDRWSLRLADAVMVLTREYQAEVLAAGVSPARAHLCPSGIDIEALRGASSDPARRTRLGLPPTGQGVVLGMVARLSAEKRPELFVAVVRALRARGLPVYGVIFGEGPLRPSLEALREAHGLREVIKLPGYVSEVADAYRCLDVLVSCSRYEGLPLNLIEAMALGVPVVTTATGGCADVVLDGETGRVVERDDEAGLIAAAAELAADEALRRRLGAAAAVRAQSRFSAAAWAASAESVYAAARARRQGP